MLRELTKQHNKTWFLWKIKTINPCINLPCNNTRHENLDHVSFLVFYRMMVHHTFSQIHDGRKHQIAFNSQWEGACVCVSDLWKVCNSMGKSRCQHPIVHTTVKYCATSFSGNFCRFDTAFGAKEPLSKAVVSRLVKGCHCVSEEEENMARGRKNIVA